MGTESFKEGQLLDFSESKMTGVSKNLMPNASVMSQFEVNNPHKKSPVD